MILMIKIYIQQKKVKETMVQYMMFLALFVE